MHFRKIYLLASVVTALFAVLSLLSKFNIYALFILILLGFPLILPLSIKSGDRLALMISLVFTALSAIVLAGCGMMFSKAESLSDFEGPNGEGAPIAPVIGMFMFGVFFMIPWSLASIRGYKHIKKQQQNKSEQTDRLPRSSQE